MEEEKLIRLNKFLAHANIGNRRECDDFIIKGFVKVNDLLITKPGTKISIKDKVTYKDEAVQAEKKVYILLNKPKNISCFKADEKINKSIYYLTYNFSEKLKLGYRPSIKPLDILKKDELGLLVITNDTKILKKYKETDSVNKVFKLKLNKHLNYEDYLSTLKNDFIEDLKFLDEEDKSILGLKTSKTNNEHLISIFEKLNYKIETIDRTVFGKLTKKDLPRGKWRFLTANEILQLTNS